MTAPLIAADIAAARALAEGATPGPWEWEAYDGSMLALGTKDMVAETEILGAHRCKFCQKDEAQRCRWPDKPNADFIAAARTLVPRLCDAVEEARRERDEARASNASAVCAWQEYGRWPDQYGAVPVGRVRWPDGREEEVALRADQITGITRGIMRHVESLLPLGLEMVTAWQTLPQVRLRAETAERERDEARAVIGEMLQAFDGTDVALQAQMLDRLRALLSPTPSQEATPVEADTMAHEDAVKPCAACIAEGEANEDGSCSCGPECPDCAKGAR